MPFEAICMICNEWFEHHGSLFNMNFLYNDGLYHGNPVCPNCIFDFFGVHLNYEPIIEREPEELEKWI